MKGKQIMSENEHGCAFYIVAFLIIIGLTCIRPIDKVSNQREITVTVTDKYVKDDKYLIYTKTTDDNIEVFEITDSLLSLRFNSSDVYAGIEIGKTYILKIGGSRNELFSWYPNIYGYKEV